MRLNSRPNALALFVLVLAVMLTVGCGSNGSAATSLRASTPTTSSTPSTLSTPLPRGPLSKAELVARADAICKRVNTEIQTPNTQSSSPQETERVVQHNLTVERAGLGSLGKLHSAKPIEHGWRRVLGDRRTLVEELVELVGDLRRNDQRAISALGLTKKLEHLTLQEDATRIGLKDCAVVS